MEGSNLVIKDKQQFDSFSQEKSGNFNNINFSKYSQKNDDIDSGLGTCSSNAFDMEEEIIKPREFSGMEESISNLTIKDEETLEMNKSPIKVLTPEIREKIAHYIIRALTPDVDNDTYLTLFLAHGRFNECAELIQICPKPVYLDIQNKHGQTALHVATHIDCAFIVNVLITYGARIDLVDAKAKNIIHLAAERGHVGTLDVILKTCRKRNNMQQFKSIINQTDLSGLTPFFLAVLKKQEEICKLLSCEDYVDVNKRDEKTGNSPLHEAVMDQHYADPQFVHTLLKDCKLDVNAQNFAGVTPLHIAAAKGDKAICSVLLLFNADVNIQDINGNIPAVYAQNEEIIKYLGHS